MMIRFKKIASSALMVCFCLLAMTEVARTQDAAKESEELDFAQGLLTRGMYDMAISQYQKFIATYPKSPALPDAYLSLGEGYFLSQDFTKAVDAFNQFNQLYPHSDKLPLSILRLGEIDIQLKKYDDALKELTAVDADNQLKGQMLQSFDFYKAQAFWDKTDVASALSFFSKAAQVDGASDYTPEALEAIGQIQVQAGHYPQALDAYHKALGLTTDDALKAELTYRIAEAQFLSGQYADATKGFDQYLTQYPNHGFDSQALANLLLAYFNLGQYDQLIKEYRFNTKKISAMGGSAFGGKDDETYFTVHLAAALGLIELSKYDQANALLDHILKFTGLTAAEKAKIYVKKSDILVREKKYQDALSVLQANAAADTDDADEIIFLKAQSQDGLEQYDKAFGLFENISLNFPNSRFLKAALLGEAHARQESGRFKEASEIFLKYYSLEDNTDLKSGALYDALMMAIKAQDLKVAIADSQEYLKDFPKGDKKVDVLLLLADSYGQNNQFKQAVDLLQGYLAGNPTPQRPNDFYFMLGFNLELMGNNDQAIAAYAKIDPHQEGGKFYVQSLKNTAIIYLREKNFDQAKVYFNLLISDASQNELQVKTYVWVCNEYLKDSKFNDVLRVANEAQKHFLPPDLVEINYFMAEAFRALGRYDDAIKYYQLVIASNRHDAYTGSAHIGLGLCLEAQQKFSDAQAQFQKALDENSDDYTVTAHANFEMANAYAAEGRDDQALRFYLLVATVYDNEHFCSESLWRAGQILEHQQKKADALKLYSEILDKYKDSPAAKLASSRMGG